MNLSSAFPCLPFPVEDLSTVLIGRLLLAAAAAAAASATSLALESDPSVDADTEFADNEGERSCSNAGFILG